MSCLKLYEPLNTLKPVAENVWIVDGPEISMRYVVGSLPFTTRMTVLRLSDGGLVLHSPTPLTEKLAADISALGEVRTLLAPNKLHYWWIGDWKARFPDATAYAAPGVGEAAKKRFTGFEAEITTAPLEWGREIACLPLVGGFMTELELFHRPSKTLVLTDTIENFEPGRVTCSHMRFLMRVGGVTDPDGSMPRDLRFTFIGRKEAARIAAKEMLAWSPERVLLAHGRCYLKNGEAELARALRWLI
ncbi:DUF4336 domain-containing protein [Afifella sp. IM 167]|uniref:DUF4336 domain-containing protein n=1 Tax=Afifella sp. IM 167 TaxID=2033586 RepID=UPI001CCCEB86|nr:DUF4336 domain-containing protein [Afifella sp. IM 167]MBZ8134695.1 DUF4336 domain-containing protein [Afifella sp. IM 167]